MISKLIVVLFAMSASATASYAQYIHCSAFQRDPNGMWSPTRKIIMRRPDGSVRLSIGPETHFGTTFRIDGIDFYSLLERNCR
jgi:hypothetical protein